MNPLHQSAIACIAKLDPAHLAFNGIDFSQPPESLIPEVASRTRAAVFCKPMGKGFKKLPLRFARPDETPEALIDRCLENRGVILIPAFSIGRTQELLYELETLIHQHREKTLLQGMAWGDLEIIVDSPLASPFAG